MKLRKYFSFAVLFGCLVASDVNGQDVTNGLIGYYPLDGNANDLSGMGLHGTVNGATLAEGINGEPNTCYDFSTGSIDILHNITFPDSNLTISTWVNIDSSSLNDVYILNLVDSNRPWYFPNANFRLITSNSREFAPTCTLSVCNPNYCDFDAYGEKKVKANVWNHLIFAFEMNSFKIYLNDQEILLTSLYGKPFIKNEQTFQKGTIGGNDKFKIDELMIFNRALNATERNLLFRKKGIITSAEVLSKQNLNIYFDYQSKKINVLNPNETIDRFELLNMSGQIVLSSFQNSSNISIETAGVNTGIYLVKVETKKGIQTKKIFLNN